MVPYVGMRMCYPLVTTSLTFNIHNTPFSHSDMLSNVLRTSPCLSHGVSPYMSQALMCARCHHMNPLYNIIIVKVLTNHPHKVELVPLLTQLANKFMLTLQIATRLYLSISQFHFLESFSNKLNNQSFYSSCLPSYFSDPISWKALTQISLRQLEVYYFVAS